MEHFYRRHLLDGVQPVTALGQAQRWLRDTTKGEKAAYFEAFLSESTGDTASNVANALYKLMILVRPGERDFVHPTGLLNVPYSLFRERTPRRRHNLVIR
jgi:hypothetical protein